MHTLISTLPEDNQGGVGFVFTEHYSYAGVDLDYVVLDDGKLTSEAAEIVELMDSYTMLYTHAIRTKISLANALITSPKT